MIENPALNPDVAVDLSLSNSSSVFIPAGSSTSSPNLTTSQGSEMLSRGGTDFLLILFFY